MPRWGMAIDMGRCIGCRSCAVVCKIHNSLPPGTWWQRVETIGAKVHHTPVGRYPDFSEVYLPVPCQHCDNAPCVKVCPVGATWQREDGLVLIDFERCIGCRYCMTACPYGVRQFNWQSSDKNFKEAFKKLGYPQDWFADSSYRPGYPLEHRTKEGRLVFTPKRPRGVVEKCTFCVQYVDQGLPPACVRGCPGNARIFGDLNDPNSLISQVIKRRDIIRMREDLNTSPKVFYLLPEYKNYRGKIIYERVLRAFEGMAANLK